jgi:site-specific DNA recombinase
MVAAHAPATLRAAIYCRVSTASQAESKDKAAPKDADDKQQETSLETQAVACVRYATQHGYRVDPDHIYQEVYTGANLWDRPKMMQLRQRLRAREVDVVLAYAVDRLSRDQAHTFILLDEAERHGARLEFVTETFEATPIGKFILSAKAFAAEVERQKITERTHRGRRSRLDSGRPLPGIRPLYGYCWADERKARLAFDPVTHRTARRLFDALLAGSSLRQLARQLTAEGIPSPAGRPHWTMAGVRSVVTNPAYSGRPQALRWQAVKNANGKKTMIRRADAETVALPPDILPPLVTPAEFTAVQLRLSLNKAHAARHNADPEATLLRGGYARCAACGATMQACYHPTRHVWRYDCNNRSQGCPQRPTIAAPLLDAAVWQRVEQLLTRPEIIAAEVARQYAADPTAADLTATDEALAETTRQQANLGPRIAQLDDDDAAAPLLAQLKRLSVRKRQLEAERAELLGRRAAWEAAQVRLDEITAWCNTVAANLGELTYADRRMAIEALGVQATVFRPDATPRYRIYASIPLDTESPDCEQISTRILPASGISVSTASTASSGKSPSSAARSKRLAPCSPVSSSE